MKLFIPLFILPILLFSCSRGDLSDIYPDELKCNNLTNPSGTESVPDFGWIVSSEERGRVQSAYQIILDQDPKNLDPENTVLWNSGKISSDQTSWIPYSGPALEPANKYFWKVRVWDGDGNPSGWSNNGYFITGLCEMKDWGDSKWIGYEDIPDSLLLVPGIHKGIKIEGDIATKRSVVPYFRKDFTINKKVKEAFVFICGLGQYELYLNGSKIGDRFLSPGWTNYQKTCLYNTFDVTENLKKGPNSIGAIVGNGFYNINRERYYKLVITYGAPKLIVNILIRYHDGTEEVVASDEAWRTIPSPVTFASIFGGEDYDARMEQPGWDKPGFNDGKWNQALLVREPGGELKAESDFPLKVLREFDPISIFKPDSGIYVYDFRQNASGIINLKIKGKRDQEIRLSPAELIGPDSLIAQKASGTPYYFSYTLKGDKEETWTPRFTYYGFRYVQVQGAVPAGKPNPDNLPVITGLRMLHTRNSSPTTGSFRCSDKLFNSIYNLIAWAINSNLASVATDCPHREKLGWLEQTHLMGNSIKYVYDIHNLFNKMINDMIETQLDNGLVPDIAPEYVQFAGGFRDSPEWSSACIILPWDLYEWYGDLEAVKKTYPMMKKYLTYLGTMAQDNILSHGLGDWYDLGPNHPGEAQLTPKSVTATSIYFYDAILLAEMADLTGEKEDAIIYRNLAEEIRIAFNRSFLNPDTKVYSTGSQTAYSMPLFFGMVDDSIKTEVVNNLITAIHENNNALTAGDVGYRYLLRTLEKEGQSQLIYEMNSKTDVPGYGFQLSKGATALTESWAGLVNVSNNHMMLGHLMEWFYSGLAGIQQTHDSKGYKHFLINPGLVGDIMWVDASYRSINGEIFCKWKRESGNFSLEVTIPANTMATIIFPQPDPGKILEGETPIGVSEFIKNIQVAGEKTFFDIPSGNYSFGAVLNLQTELNNRKLSFH
ncbi:MAG: family 78 glycoside hydrolase catalytic domain [Bacteroidia bacterium]|nr:family 78 glycoside hydrolase catalytic domain [Bacteroidia bacterium]